MSDPLAFARAIVSEQLVNVLREALGLPTRERPMRFASSQYFVGREFERTCDLLRKQGVITQIWQDAARAVVCVKAERDGAQIMFTLDAEDFALADCPPEVLIAQRVFEKLNHDAA